MKINTKNIPSVLNMNAFVLSHQDCYTFQNLTTPRYKYIPLPIILHCEHLSKGNMIVD